MPKQYLPRSSSAAFTKQWQKSIEDEGFLEQLVERWRSAGLGAQLDAQQQAAQLAEAMGGSNSTFDDYAPAPEMPRGQAQMAPPPARRLGGMTPRDAAPAPQGAVPQRRAAPVAPPAPPASPTNGGARSLRERLLSRS